LVCKSNTKCFTFHSLGYRHRHLRRRAGSTVSTVFQIANVVAGRQEGTGLGLALTQKLAELHSGWVVKSEINHGSQFTVVLPYTSSAGRQGESRGAGERGVPTQSGLGAKGAQEKGNFTASTSTTATAPIMLVEDNLHNAKLMTTYLKKLGYQVIWVKNAAQMWQALEGRNPH